MLVHLNRHPVEMTRIGVGDMSRIASGSSVRSFAGQKRGTGSVSDPRWPPGASRDEAAPDFHEKTTRSQRDGACVLIRSERIVPFAHTPDCG